MRLLNIVVNARNVRGSVGKSCRYSWKPGINFSISKFLLKNSWLLPIKKWEIKTGSTHRHHAFACRNNTCRFLQLLSYLPSGELTFLCCCQGRSCSAHAHHMQGAEHAEYRHSYVQIPIHLRRHRLSKLFPRTIHG